VFHAISYYMIGLRNDATSFFTHYAFLLLICGSAEGIALIVSAAAKGPQEAAAAVPGPLIISILFGGFFISADKIPIFISWLRYLTLTKYGFEGIMQVQFENRDLCDKLPSECVCAATDAFCPQTGEEILEFYNLTDLSVTKNAIVLFAYCIITRLIAYMVLLRNVPKRVRM
jgi:ATP-binding cassette subfamily G (WHITE) protein 2